MSTGEIGWRIGRRAASLLERRGNGDNAAGWAETEFAAALDRFRNSVDRPWLLDRDRAALIAERRPTDAAELIASADRAVQLRFTYFGYPEVTLPSPVDWHLDPGPGVRWPTSASAKIDYRTADADVKWIWELNRLQHLPWLAQAWLITDDARYGSAAFAQLDSWIDQHPPGMGIGWRNPFEPGVRAISIALALQGFRDHPELTADRFGRIVSLLAESARRCWVDRSRYSSANNHLIGELAGLAVVAIVFPDLPDAPTWEREAVAMLEEETDRQLLADGAGAEQAVGYQIFTVELFLIVAVLLLERDGELPPRIRAAADRSAAYLAALVGEADPTPRYGDDDEGFAFRLDGAPLRTLRDHLGLVAVLTGSEHARRCGTATWTSDWFEHVGGRPRPLVAEPLRTTLSSVSNSSADGHFAPDGGVVVLRAGKRRVVMDVGPLGFLSIAAHGHADALATTVSIDGHDIIGDPGPASYYGHPDWRRIHRGTRVHATVEVDGCDQSVVAGPFMWSSHARVRVLGVDLDAGVVDAEHHGYRRFRKPVTHRRWLIANPELAAVLVVDLMTGAGWHQIRTSWPLGPSLDLADDVVGHLVVRGGSPLVHVATAATTPLVDDRICGDEAQGLGWWSNRLESREPAWLIGSSTEGELPLAIATVIQPAGDGDLVIDPAVTMTAGEIRVTWSDSREQRQAVIDITRFASVSLRPLA